MADGTIKIITDRGFGYIQPAHGRVDIFFHPSALVDAHMEQLHQGDHVTFTIADDSRGKGLRASQVRVIDVIDA